MANAKPEEDWRRLNRANWDERVPVHLGPGSDYDFAGLRAGNKALRIVDDELGPVDGLRVLHLQCHIGTDTLALAQRGATVVGLDFSAPALEAARALAAELGLSARARFVQSDVYDAPTALADERFDLVFTTFGTTCWLPDIQRWAKVVAHFVKPDGTFYFADAHPAAYVFDDLQRGADGRPGFWAPYFSRAPLVVDETTDYADPTARLENTATHNWIHPLGDTVSALIAAGLRIEWLHEHDAVPWRMFGCQVMGEDGLYRWPDKPWLPLSYSLRAVKE